MTTEPPLTLDLAEGRRLLDELRWTQAYPDDDRTAAIDNAQLSRLIDLVHTLLSLAERAQQMEELLATVRDAASDIEHTYECFTGIETLGRPCICGVDRIRHAVLTKEPTR